MKLIKYRTDEWYKKLYDLLENEKTPTMTEIKSILNTEVSNISTVIVTKKSIETVPNNIDSEDNSLLDHHPANQNEDNKSKAIIDDFTIIKCKHFDMIVPELIKKYLENTLKPNCKQLLDIFCVNTKNECEYPLNNENVDDEERLCELSNWLEVNKEFAEDKEIFAKFISQATICLIYYEKKEIYKKAIFELVNNIAKIDSTYQKSKITEFNFWSNIIQFLLTKDKNKAVMLVSCNSLGDQSKNCDSEEELKILKVKYNALNTKLNNLLEENNLLKEKNNKLENEVKTNINNNKALTKDVFELKALNDDWKNKYDRKERELKARNSAFDEFKDFIEKEKSDELIATKLKLKKDLMIDLNNAKIFFEREKGNNNIDLGLETLESALENINNHLIGK